MHTLRCVGLSAGCSFGSDCSLRIAEGSKARFPTPAPFARMQFRSSGAPGMATFKNFRRDRDRRSDSSGSGSSRDGDPNSVGNSNLPKHLQRLREIEQEGEPLSMAEELADMMAHHREEAGTEERYEELKKSGFQIAD